MSAAQRALIRAPTGLGDDQRGDRRLRTEYDGAAMTDTTRTPQAAAEAAKAEEAEPLAV
ncbi:hypothetical protein [Streptomyces sp. NPDC058755]|uniref:hypothetical protein n=1 Tax=Streptomyces sp. NPDC058755 TaxID=3346624 RepID=UPI003685F646